MDIESALVDRDKLRQRFWYDQLAFSAVYERIEQILFVYKAIDILIRIKGVYEGFFD